MDGERRKHDADPSVKIHYYRKAVDAVRRLREPVRAFDHLFQLLKRQKETANVSPAVKKAIEGWFMVYHPDLQGGGSGEDAGDAGPPT